jgi:hypothetical protein
MPSVLGTGHEVESVGMSSVTKSFATTVSSAYRKRRGLKARYRRATCSWKFCYRQPIHFSSRQSGTLASHCRAPYMRDKYSPQTKQAMQDYLFLLGLKKGNARPVAMSAIEERAILELSHSIRILLGVLCKCRTTEYDIACYFQDYEQYMMMSRLVVVSHHHCLEQWNFRN